MKSKFVLIVIVLISITMFSSCGNVMSFKDNNKIATLMYDSGKVTKVDRVNDFVYVDTNKRKGADVRIDGALSKDSSLKKGDFVFYGYYANKRVDTLKKIKIINNLLIP